MLLSLPGRLVHRFVSSPLSHVGQLLIFYSPECVEGEFSEVRQKNPLACDRYSHTANGGPQAWLPYLPAPSTTPAEEFAGCPGDTYCGQYPAVEAPPASYPPAQNEQDGHYGHKRVGPSGPGKQEACVHEDPEEGGYTGKGPEDKGDPDQGLSEDHQVGEQGGVGHDHLLQERGVPPRHLGMLARGLGYGALSEALDGCACALAYPAALGPLAQGGVQPLVAEPEPQDQPH